MTEAFDALGHTFTVSVTDDQLAGHVRDLFAGFDVCVTAAPHVYVVDDDGVSYDGDRLALRCAVAQVLAVLLSHVNRAVAAAARNRYALLHASAVVHGEGALLMPGPPDAGKSTLAGGLLQAGCAYLTDEMVAVDPSSGAVEPYRKPLSIDAGSWPALASLKPALPRPLAEYHSSRWQVVARRFAPQSAPRWIVFPRFEERAPTRVTPLRPAEAVMAMAQNSFNFRDDGRRWLPVIGDVAAACSAYRLTFSDLDAAVVALMDLTA